MLTRNLRDQKHTIDKFHGPTLYFHQIYFVGDEMLLSLSLSLSLSIYIYIYILVGDGMLY